MCCFVCLFVCEVAVSPECSRALCELCELFVSALLCKWYSQEESLMDFGFEQAFYALDGECVSLRDDPFEYQVCPFHNVSQIERAKIGSKETVFDLGRFRFVRACV